MGANNMMTVIERAMAAGHSVLVENMGESIDAALNPVITRCALGGAGRLRWGVVMGGFAASRWLHGLLRRRLQL